MPPKSQKTLESRFAGPYESPGFLLWRVSNVWQRAQRNALQPFGITHTQFVALAVACWFGQHEQITQVRLSQLTGSDPMTTSQVVKALEKLGLFERTPHPKDTRAKIITVSETGRETAIKAMAVVEATDEEFFKNLGGESSTIIKLFKDLL